MIMMVQQWNRKRMITSGTLSTRAGSLFHRIAGASDGGYNFGRATAMSNLWAMIWTAPIVRSGALPGVSPNC
jgi:hypothetical protein